MTVVGAQQDVEQAAPRVEVRLAGPLEVRVGGHQVRLRGRQNRALVAALALAEGRTVPRRRLATALWPSDDQPRAATSLHTLVYRVRAQLGSSVLVSTDTGYRLVGCPLLSDVVAIRRGAAAARSRRRLDTDDLDAALESWTGDVLGDLPLHFPWAAEERDRLEEDVATVVEALASDDLTRGRAGRHLALVAGLAKAHPLRESLIHVLLRMLHAQGRTAEALERYESLRRTLAQELGVDPSPPLRAWHRLMLEHMTPSTDGHRATVSAGMTRALSRLGVDVSALSGGPDGRAARRRVTDEPQVLIVFADSREVTEPR